MAYKILLFVSLLLFLNNAWSQSDSTVISHNIKSLQKYATDRPVEKVHLHLDRQLYFAGDTIWFKAYVVLGEYHKLSALSGILYVELINGKDSILKRITLGLNAGTAPGDLELPYNIAGGIYHIQAYTNWMRNDGPAYFYNQLITIASFSKDITPVNKALTQRVDGASPQVQDKIDLQFFPEGGSLINGMRSKIAFKAINQNGLAEEIQGTITDNLGNEVASFASQRLGMGVFPLEPQKGKSYLAKIIAADGSRFSVPLPAALDSGFILSVNGNLADSIYIKVAAKGVPDKAFYLIAQSGGRYYFAAGRKLENAAFTATLAKNRFPSGILQFTLFSENGEPVNERIIFIQNSDQIKLSLTTEKQVYSPGEKVKVNIDAQNKNGMAATGTFSISVLDESKVPVNARAESTIFPDLLLKSELAGYIQDPNYYFVDPSDQTRSDLDMLMLTQGYHRFEWKKILADNDKPLAYQPEKGFSLSGMVATPSGKAIAKGRVILTSLRSKIALDTLTDSGGKFAFRNLVFSDTGKVVVNAKKANGGSNVVLTIDKPDYPAAGKIYNKEKGYLNDSLKLTAEEFQQAYAAWHQDSLGHVIQLKEVNIKDHKNIAIHPDYAVLLKHSTNLNGPGQADQVIMGDQFVGCSNIIDCLLYLAHGGIRLVNKASGTIIYSTHTPIEFSGVTKPMAVLLDGVILDQSELVSVSPTDVQSIEMLESPRFSSIYGSAASGGLIIITTKYGDEPMQQVTVQPGLTVYHFNGFYKARKFYSPKYEAGRSVTLADNRKTIYWDPAILTGENGKSSCQYFNAESKGTYRIVIEGIDADGDLGRQVYTYTVE